MYKVFLISFAFLSSLMIMEGCSTMKASQDSGNIVRSKTINLFNGKNLDGWYTFLQNRGRDNDPKKVFTVHDGLIHILSLDFKQESNGNSGVFFRSSVREQRLAVGR